MKQIVETARARHRSAEFRPTAHRPCGVGADSSGGVHYSRRHRRRRRPDGAHHPGHRQQAQPDEAADGGDQQGRRRRRRRLPRRQELAQQPAQDHHHAVEPFHDADGDGHSLQLEGSDAGRDAGARRIRPVGECRQALQDRQGICRGGEGRERHIQDGGHRLQAGRPDHHRGHPEGHRRQVHLHPGARRRRGGGAVGRQSRRLDGQQSDRGGRAMARRSAASALRVRYQARSTTRTRSPATWRGPTSRPARSRASTSTT